MPRQCGSGSSSEAQVRNRHSAQSRTEIRIMLRPSRVSVCVRVLAIVALLIIGLQRPRARAQNTADDVHIKPRTETKPPSHGTKELEAGCSPDRKPPKS